VRRQISSEQARRIAALEIEAIGFIKEAKRRYPNRDLAAHIVGYVGTDNTGLGGIEATYDDLIKGEPGTIFVQTDARRNAFSRIERPPTKGSTLELTIDQYLQYVAERELRAGVALAGAASGSAVVMDPRTGEVLALANYPTFNPNTFREADARQRRNRAVQDLYDPGSTFKVVTASALLEEKVVRAADMFDVSSGTIRFGSRVIHDDHRYRVLSFEDVIVKSSNVGTIQAVSRLGERRAERLIHFVRQFGFGQPSSRDFPGESPGIVWKPQDLNDSALASVAMGYQVSVTPLQTAAAVSAVANGGELIEPRVVRAVIRNGSRAVVPHNVVRRAISRETAAEMTRIMEAVVTRGTGKSAQVEGYTVAGKTGTAHKVVNRAYSRTDYNVSFVGFVPSTNPVFTIAVVVDTPRKQSAYGGVVAAPIFKRIAEAALRHRAVPPAVQGGPPILVARRHAGDEPRERPTAGPVDRPAIVTMGGAADPSPSGFPDLTGMSARDAVRMLSQLGLKPVLHGAGLVVSQRPTAGAPLDSGVTATLWLRRQQAVGTAGATTP
jgi:cell division protein FtsI (penicillin-binding protein 3)